MKRYLFDKIEYNGIHFRFIPFRRASIYESFWATTNGSFNESEWTFSPMSFKHFLSMLSVTKLKEDNEYDIFVEIQPGVKAPLSFDRMLQLFAKEVYSSKEPRLSTLSKFYAQAHAVKEQTEANKKLLEMEPSEFLNPPQEATPEE